MISLYENKNDCVLVKIKRKELEQFINQYNFMLKCFNNAKGIESLTINVALNEITDKIIKLETIIKNFEASKQEV